MCLIYWEKPYLYASCRETAHATGFHGPGYPGRQRHSMESNDNIKHTPMQVHFIAIGGSAMHNLAIALKLKGDKVSGSDDEIFEPSRSRLAKHSLLPHENGWFQDKIHRQLDAVIVGMHARPDNPELLRAQQLNVPVYSYPEYLYRHAREKTRIVIGGSHGKTSITAMILHVMQKLDVVTDYMVGAQLDGFDVMVKLSGDAPYMVMEGDEYPSAPTDPRPKFHLYRPHIGVISGIAWDHVNVFKTWESYLDQFRKFIHCIQDPGKLIYCDDDQVVRKLCTEEAPASLLLYPYRLPEYRKKEGRTCIVFRDKEYRMQVFGKHNLLNLEAARQVCQQVGISGHDFYSAMTIFSGASRRLEKLYENEGMVVIRDFAHAPSKLRATVEAAREEYPGHKLVACMELHTYSSLNGHFIKQYRGTMDKAGKAIVFYNPEALRLKRLPDLQPGMVKEAFAREGLEVITDAEILKSRLYALASGKTCVLLMSSGSLGGFDLDSYLEHVHVQATRNI